MAVVKKRKKIFDVEIPLINKTTQAIAYDVKELKDRYITYDLTRILRGKSIMLHSKIEIEKENPIAIPKWIELMPYYLRRIVRKGTNYIEDSFSAETKDAQIKIKPLLVTRRKVSRAVRKVLRNKAKEELIKYLKTKTLEETFKEILKNTLQKSLSLKLKKIYPLSACEIRFLKVEKEILKVEKEKIAQPKEEVEKKE